jgi:sensor histidine kinase YesM
MTATSSRHQLRTRVFLFSVFSTLVLGLASLYNQLNSKIYLRGMTRILGRSRPYLELQDQTVTLGSLLETYLSTKNYSTLKEYWTRSQILYNTVWDLDRTLTWDRSSLLREDLVELIQSYLRATQDAINAKRGRDVPGYTEAFARSERILGFIKQTTADLVQADYLEGSRQGQRFADQLATLQLFNILMLLSLMTLGVILGFWFSGRLTGPLSRLAESARQIAEGNYGISVAPYRRQDEIGLLTVTFETMRTNIIRNIDELTERAEIENRLMSERLDNLRIKNLLKIAELHALQAQVNPHFLFNTLNTGVQLAILEDADHTRLYIEHLADVFRNNIRTLDRLIPLSDELHSIESYIYIMRIRFADRFAFRIQLPSPCPDPLMPAMILQPLVENAITHGLRDREADGWVEITVSLEDGWLHLAVTDNGAGIAPERLGRILAVTEDAGNEAAALEAVTSDDISRKSNGIGLANVISRMRLHFGDPDIVSIASQPGSGTRIAFRLPLPREVDLVQSPDC